MNPMRVFVSAGILAAVAFTAAVTYATVIEFHKPPLVKVIRMGSTR